MLLVCWPDLAYQLYHLSDYLECFNYYCINCLAQQVRATIGCAWYNYMIYTGDYRVNEQRRFTTCLRGFWGAYSVGKFYIWCVRSDLGPLSAEYVLYSTIYSEIYEMGKFLHNTRVCLLHAFLCGMHTALSRNLIHSTSFAHDVWHSHW